MLPSNSYTKIPIKSILGHENKIKLKKKYFLMIERRDEKSILFKIPNNIELVKKKLKARKIGLKEL